MSRTRRRMRRHRRARQLRAWVGGYFWLPCPMCGEYFGGNEGNSRLSIPTDEQGGSTWACQACEDEQGRKARAWCNEHGHSPVQSWNMRTVARTSHEDADGTHHRVSGAFDMSAVPDNYYCSTCFADLDKRELRKPLVGEP